MISALVILNPASGNAPEGAVNITTENLASYLPDPSAAHQTREHFATLGMKCGPVVGRSFAIEGQASMFESFFGGSVRKHGESFQFLASDGTETNELPLHGLPPEIRRTVAAVVFPKAPDFGPGNFGGNP